MLGRVSDGTFLSLAHDLKPWFGNMVEKCHGKVLPMNASSRCVGLFASAIIASVTIGPADASPRLVCNVLPLAEVRAIVGGSPIYQPGSKQQRGDSTLSSCGYLSGERGGRGVLLVLISAPSSTLAAYQAASRADTKHTSGATAVQDGVYVSVRVANDEGINLAVSEKLLAAVLRKI